MYFEHRRDTKTSKVLPPLNGRVAALGPINCDLTGGARIFQIGMPNIIIIITEKRDHRVFTDPAPCDFFPPKK